ncbi:MAG: protein translocase subunit SecF [Deltaproteobacteria bacterium]|nr:protein translocase subunit SecF [Deltaproteobacteria bacterium]
MEIVKPGTRYDFIGKRRVTYFISLALVTVALVVMVKPGLRLGVEFRGGWECELGFGKPVEVRDFRASLAGSGTELLQGVEIQRLGDPEEGNYLIRGTGEAEEARVVSSLQAALSGQGDIQVRRFESVGARVGSDLLERAIIALLVALAGIMIYLSMRFSWRFAPGAVLALIHDVLVATGVVTLLGIEFTLPVLAALLALIGFSTNDTVVVYDRIRENLRRRRRPDFATLINVSLNEILGRTILTSGALLVVAVSLLLFGGPVLRDFALTLSVGVIAGTYSSVFVAGALTLEIEKRWPAPKF